MNSRERLQCTLNHHEPDRVPFDLGSSFTSGIHVMAYRNLRQYLGLPLMTDIPLFTIDEQIAMIGDDVKARLGVDVEGVLPGNPVGWELNVEDRGDHTYFVNEWQMGLKMPKDGGLYYDVVDHPFKDFHSLADLETFDWPDPCDPARFAGLAEKTQAAAASGRGVALNNICAGAIEMGAWLCGYERFYSGLLLEPEFTSAVMDKVLEIKMAYWDIALKQAGDNVDVVLESDDLGEQTRPMISPRLYRSMIKPRHKKLFDFIHARTNAKINLHSCGAIRPLIPDLIEVGVDILNPVQIGLVGMDPQELKQEYGRDLVFWGGTVNAQKVFGTGTPEQVREEARRNIEILAQGGGFICAAVHNIQANVPPQNIMALWEALQEYNR